MASEPESNSRTDQSPADAWSQGIRSQGREPAETITVETVLAAGRIGELLELPADEPVVVRRRLRYVDHVLHTTADTYFPRAMVAGTAIELPTDVLPGALTVLADVGYPINGHRDTIRVRPPTSTEADLFDLGPGVAVAEHVRVRRTAEGRVGAATVSVLPGDRNEIMYERSGR
ncbi:MAG: UTRA domain-containing protein [Natronosporangium sp.]